jgi:hypothetical protein
MSGGLSLFWHESMFVEVKDMNQKILMLIFVCHLMNPCGELLVCMVNHVWIIGIEYGLNFRPCEEPQIFLGLSLEISMKRYGNLNICPTRRGVRPK